MNRGHPCSLPSVPIITFHNERFSSSWEILQSFYQVYVNHGHSLVLTSFRTNHHNIPQRKFLKFFLVGDFVEFLPGVLGTRAHFLPYHHNIPQRTFLKFLGDFAEFLQGIRESWAPVLTSFRFLPSCIVKQRFCLWVQQYYIIIISVSRSY